MMTPAQKKYVAWLKKNVKVKTVKWFAKFKDFISKSNVEVCDFYIFRNCIKVVWLDKSAKWYMVKPSK